MACKRTATSDLNHDNWDKKEEPEEAGTFVPAPQEVLEKRVVKAARRRLPRSADRPATESTKSPFGLFSGFKATPAPSASPFSFLSKSNTSANPTTSENTLTQSSMSGASNGSRKTPENGTDGSGPTESSTGGNATSQGGKKLRSGDKEDRIFKKSSDYFAKLKGLNESVTQWIKSHVDSNPFCILTPIFRDYEKYLKDIEAKHAHESFLSAEEDVVPEKPLATSSKLSTIGTMEKTLSAETSSDENKLSFSEGVKTTTSTSPASFNWGSQKPSFGDMKSTSRSIFDTGADKKDNKPTFGSISTENNPFFNKTSSLPQISEETDKSKSDKSSGFGSFGQSTAASATFSFGQSSTTGSPPSAGFSFGSAKPFSFGSHVVAAAQNTETKPDEDKEEDDEPPKPDFKPITEEDAFFEKRCKVFVKKDGNFSDRGVGTLFLKTTPNGKTQLIVRADNSLGNLLLNTLLTSSIPTKRMNKNTVMMVCLPTPDSKPPPTPVLLRVKTSEDADNLVETLDNNKK